MGWYQQSVRSYGGEPKWRREETRWGSNLQEQGVVKASPCHKSYACSRLPLCIQILTRISSKHHSSASASAPLPAPASSPPSETALQTHSVIVSGAPCTSVYRPYRVSTVQYSQLRARTEKAQYRKIGARTLCCQRFNSHGWQNEYERSKISNYWPAWHYTAKCQRPLWMRSVCYTAEQNNSRIEWGTWLQSQSSIRGKRPAEFEERLHDMMLQHAIRLQMTGFGISWCCTLSTVNCRPIWRDAAFKKGHEVSQINQFNPLRLTHSRVWSSTSHRVKSPLHSSPLMISRTVR